MEIWKDIVYDGEDYTNLYQVSNLGRVKSLNYRKERVLQPNKNNNGYLRVGLCKDGKRKFFSIHRLVATTFLENPENKLEVNHKDEDKTNNFVGTPENDYKDGNLEWCDKEYNNNYGTRVVRIVKKTTNGKLSKPVLQFTLTGEFIREWPSTAECERNGFNHGNVSSCCQGKKLQYKGFIWKYKEKIEI